ncbi:MAG: heptosyltransferase [Pseudomonadota bacterium]|nr:heptosyltransferase [Pseudomonadota bacterium]
MCLPAIKYLQTLNIPMILMGRAWIHDLLKDLDIPKKTWPKSHIQAIQTLRAIPYKNLLLFTNSFSSAMIAITAGKKAIGYAKDCRGPLLYRAIPKPKNYHETTLFNRLTKTCLNVFYPQIQIDEFSQIPEINLKQLLINKSLPTSYIVLCPFAHGKNRQGQSKKWPHWQALFEKLKHLHPIICPGPNEIEEAERQFPKNHILQGLSLYDYLQVLSQAQCVIANDSGPLHMAAALNCPTIGLFGATCEKRTAPRRALILGHLGQWPDIETVFYHINEIILHYDA